ncbi:MAG: glycoside hydrolase family 68 protein [Sphingopyxis sp.]|nr:glycoside hydrolase family 68 protein [Sphingopyxis sp.]
MPNLLQEDPSFPGPTPTQWTFSIDDWSSSFAHMETRAFNETDLRFAVPGLWLWDIWPVQDDHGMVAQVAGGDLWVMLSAPRTANPDDRHGHARLRLLFRRDGQWRDCGAMLPDNFSPGSREWSGSTRLDPASGKATTWFTATGRRGDDGHGFEQRLFQAVGRLQFNDGLPNIADWHDLNESVASDANLYADTAVTPGVAGMIKGFRDPYWFRDPADGQGYLLFTGSKGGHRSNPAFDGVIGLARAQDRDGFAPFTLNPPLIDSEPLVNEMERPHVFVHEGLYYLFWSSQRHVFAPDARAAPTGLYGMVASALHGPYTPLNGSGLVLANPASEPRQAYAWQVLPGSLEVISFIDFWGVKGRDIDNDPVLKSAQFGGTIAPFARIALDGATSRIIATGA